MTQVRCIIQEGGNADVRSGELERRLSDHHATNYPGEDTAVSWMAIPSGYMFTEGRQSTSSVITFFLPHRTTLADREAYMRGVCDLWTDVTDCTDHEIVVTITETTSDQE